MTVHIMVTNWVVETKMASSKRLYCVVLGYRGLVSGQSLAPRPLFPEHRVTRGVDVEGGQELPLSPGTLVHLGSGK